MKTNNDRTPKTIIDENPLLLLHFATDKRFEITGFIKYKKGGFDPNFLIPTTRKLWALELQYKTYKIGIVCLSYLKQKPPYYTVYISCDNDESEFETNFKDEKELIDWVNKWIERMEQNK